MFKLLLHIARKKLIKSSFTQLIGNSVEWSSLRRFSLYGVFEFIYVCAWVCVQNHKKCRNFVEYSMAKANRNVNKCDLYGSRACWKLQIMMKFVHIPLYYVMVLSVSADDATFYLRILVWCIANVAFGLYRRLCRRDANADNLVVDFKKFFFSHMRKTCVRSPAWRC